MTKTGGESPLAAQSADLLRHYEKAFDQFEVHAAIARLMEFATTCNTYIEMSAPWKLTKDSSRSEALDHVLFALAESLRVIGVLISPLLPKSAHGIFDQLNWKMEPEWRGKEKRFSLADAEWGRLLDGHVVSKPVPLFPRIEIREGV